MSDTNIQEAVRQKYAQAARQVAGGQTACCGGAAETAGHDPITADLYADSDTAGLPKEAVLASLGCGNPTALAELKPGETVLDLGSGGGIDVLLSARRVGPAGKAYGLDMTDEMLALARENQRKAGATNVEFLKGTIENIPLPDNSVDVIISNCVINLSADKDRVFREALRVLKPGGRLAVSDIVVRGAMPAEVRKNLELWAGCLAGALEESEYREKLARAGFEAIELEPTRTYKIEDAREFLAQSGIDMDAMAQQIEGSFTTMSAFIRAKKPADVTRSRTHARKVEVYDPAMCCSTGVCGPAIDPKLTRFAADLDWLAAQGVAVERFNLAQQPQAFAANETVKTALTVEGTDCLPLILVNGNVVSQGTYPQRSDLARWAGVDGGVPASIYADAVAELVALGAAIASNCQPCFKYHFDSARKLGVSKEDMALAVKTAQGVKDAPARAILELADRFLGERKEDVSLPVVGSVGTGSKSGCCS